MKVIDNASAMDELLKCAASPIYFIENYVQIYDPEVRSWIPFKLWLFQIGVLFDWIIHQLNLDLKARQMGLTWLALALGLHGMIFEPIFELLLFSRREDEALYLLGDERLRGMYKRLPKWMQCASIINDSAGHFRLSNGSGARAFPSNAGDSYTATMAIIDEADLVPDLKQLLGKVEPTINAGGKLLLISRVDKSEPNSTFKQIYRAARAGQSPYHAGFLPWHAHPKRDQAWYDRQVASALAQDGTLDAVWEQYPATDTEALAPRSLDKRFMPVWLEKCYKPMKPLKDVPGAPAIPGLEIYVPPVRGRRYVIGLDPAEGNPTSDDSAAIVTDAITLEEVAMLSGKFEPEVLAHYADMLGQWYNHADILPERNNHGHAVLLWLKLNSKLKVLQGSDMKLGWLSNTPGKVQMYDKAADIFKEGAAIIHSFKLMTQLQSIVGTTLRAPGGEMEDCSDAYVLTVAGVLLSPRPQRPRRVAVSGLYEGNRRQTPFGGRKQ